MPIANFQGQEVRVLKSGTDRVLIAPAYGARLLSWMHHEESIIHWPADADWSSHVSLAKVRGGNPILFPFIGRHYVDGELGKWMGEDGLIRELPMHGFAREMPFGVIESTDDILKMRLAANDETRLQYPYDFVFDVTYSLEPEVLTVTFETENAGTEPMPYMAGHHFYFEIPHETREQWTIDLPRRTWGTQSPDGNVHFEDAAAYTITTLADNSLIDRFHLDFIEPRVTLQNAHTKKSIAIEWDEDESKLWHDVTTWTLSPEADFYCVEPWLGLPNAIHHGHGLRWLEPGETEAATCWVRLSQ